MENAKRILIRLQINCNSSASFVLLRHLQVQQFLLSLKKVHLCQTPPIQRNSIMSALSVSHISQPWNNHFRLFLEIKPWQPISCRMQMFARPSNLKTVSRSTLIGSIIAAFFTYRLHLWWQPIMIGCLTYCTFCTKVLSFCFLPP